MPYEGRAESPAPTGVKYYTMFRKEDTGAPPKEVAKDGKMENTLDGIIVTGRDYFHAFHIDREVNHGR